LLVSGQPIEAVKEFENAELLETSLADKEYLVRGLFAAAARNPDRKRAKQQREKALRLYTTIVSKPGVVWEWAQQYPPGYLAEIKRSFSEENSRATQDETTVHQPEPQITRR